MDSGVLLGALAAPGECLVHQPDDVEGVGGDLCGGGQSPVADELSYRAEVALTGVDADHIDGIDPPLGPGPHSLAQAGGVSTVEHVDDLPGGGIDHRGDKLAPPSARPARIFLLS